MPEFIETISRKTLLSIPMPKNDNIMLIDMKQYLHDLKHQTLDSYLDSIDTLDSYWGSVDTADQLRELNKYNTLPHYGLIIITGQMDPECYLHSLTYSEIEPLAKLKDYELDSDISQYCRKLSKYLNDNTKSFCIDVQSAIPNNNSKAIVK